MKSVFIGGIPTAGKSYLAKKLSAQLGIKCVGTDEIRDEFQKDPILKPWAEFYSSKDEKEYYDKTSCKDQWKNLTMQSEAFWPNIVERVRQMESVGEVFIIEGVNILPHLAARDFSFSGVYLLGNSVEQVFERNKKDPRWGKTEELQRMEAEAFFHCERPNYAAEAERFGFKTFTDAAEAEQEILKMIKAD